MLHITQLKYSDFVRFSKISEIRRCYIATLAKGQNTEQKTDKPACELTTNEKQAFHYFVNSYKNASSALILLNN